MFTYSFMREGRTYTSVEWKEIESGFKRSKNLSTLVDNVDKSVDIQRSTEVEERFRNGIDLQLWIRYSG